MSWIHIHDLVEMILVSLKDQRWSGPINAVAPTPLRNSEMTKIMAQVFGRPAVLPAPKLGLKLVLGEMSELMLASQRVLPQQAQSLGFRFSSQSYEVALRDLYRNVGPGEELVIYEQWLPLPIEEAFPFFASEKNLERITPEWLNFKVVGKSTPHIGEGTEIEYHLRLHGVPVKWKSRIEDWSENKRFVDRQILGPYSLWHHTHEFSALAGGTLMRDRVRYSLPMGWISHLAAGWYVKGDVKRIFDYRQKSLPIALNITDKK